MAIGESSKFLMNINCHVRQSSVIDRKLQIKTYSDNETSVPVALI